MDLQAFLAWSRLQALAPALQEAGVESVQDLQAYYEDIRALAPEEFRQEMAETFSCKRIEISRLVAALEKLASAEAVGQPQKPRTVAVGGTATGVQAPQREPSARSAMSTEPVRPEAWNDHGEHEVTVPRTVSPLAQEVAARRDSHDLCAEFDEPMTAETPWLAAAVVSAETNQPANPPPPYDDAWLPSASESAEAVRHPGHDFELITSTESPDVLADAERADRVDVAVVVDDDHVFTERYGDMVDDESHDVAVNEESAVVAEEVVADVALLDGSGAELELEVELMEDGDDEARASEDQGHPIADAATDETDAGEDGVIVESVAQSGDASVSFAAAAAAVAAVAAVDGAQTSDAEEDEHHHSALCADSQELVEPSAPMFNSASHEDDYDLQAVSEEFDTPLTCTVSAPLALPVSAPDAAALDVAEISVAPEDDDDSAAASGDGTTTGGPKCTVTSAMCNPAENVVVVSVHVAANDPLDVDEVVANCVVVLDGRALNARSHELHCSEEQHEISGSLTFDLGLRPLDAGTELPQLRFEYDGEEISPVLQLTTVGVDATAGDLLLEPLRRSSESILAASVSTEVFEMHGLDHSAELQAAAPLMHSPSLPAPAPSSGSHTLEAAARQALFVADEFETTDGEDDRSSHSSAYTRPSAPSSSMGSPVLAAPAAGGAVAAGGMAGLVAGIGASVGSIATYTDSMVSFSELPTVEAVYVSGEGEVLQDGVAVEAEIVDLDVVGQQDEAGGLNVSEIVAPPPPVPASRRLDVPTMDLIARQPKSGPLKKYAKYMKGSWHERYFVLDGRALWYFKTKKDFNRNNEMKRRVLELVPTSSAVRLSTPSTFAVGNRTDSWTLQAANDTDMYEWMNAINAHVHFLYIRMHGLRVGGFGELLDFPHYFTLTTRGKKAMAIRSIPDGKGPRTGGVIQPGEIIEVVQLYPAGAQPQDDEVFFRLADDKGWVFQVTADGDKVIAPAAGFAFNEDGCYQIHARCRTPVPLRFGPSFHSQSTGETLRAGEKFRACRRWVSGVNEGADFLKLVASSGKEGWVQVFNRPREAVTEPTPQQIVQEITEEEFLGQNVEIDDVAAPPLPQEDALQPAHTAAV